MGDGKPVIRIKIEGAERQNPGQSEAVSGKIRPLERPIFQIHALADLVIHEDK
jgi:hypothetical protein